MAAADSELLERCLSFEIGLERAASESVEESGWGEVLLSPSLPLVWHASWILVEEEGLGAAQVAALADEALGGAGFLHRTVVVRDADEGRRLRPGFAALEGWEVERNLFMVWRGAPDREPEVATAERRHAEVDGLRRAMITGDISLSGPRTAETVQQLLEWERRIGVAGGDRWFVAAADGEPASACRLLAADGVGQVEDVGTLSAARQRGLARAVTLAAARASRAAGHRLTFLTALADDWPRLIYAKLGFEPVGELYEFRRRPPAGS